MEALKQAWDKRLIIRKLKEEKKWEEHINLLSTSQREEEAQFKKIISYKEKMQNLYNQEIAIQLELICLKSSILSKEQLTLCLGYVRNLINEANQFQLSIQQALIKRFLNIEDCVLNSHSNTHVKQEHKIDR